jgi:hypothetical protein
LVLQQLRPLPSQLGVVICVKPLILDFFLTQLTFHLGRHTCHKRLGWDILGDHRPSGNKSPSPNGDAIEHNGTDTNQTASLKQSTMNNGSMSNRHVFTNVNRKSWIAVQNSPLLNVAAGTDMNGCHIATRNGRWPNACP